MSHIDAETALQELSVVIAGINWDGEIEDDEADRRFSLEALQAQDGYIRLPTDCIEMDSTDQAPGMAWTLSDATRNLPRDEWPIVSTLPAIPHPSDGTIHRSLIGTPSGATISVDMVHGYSDVYADASVERVRWYPSGARARAIEDACQEALGAIERTQQLIEDAQEALEETATPGAAFQRPRMRR